MRPYCPLFVAICVGAFGCSAGGGGGAAPAPTSDTPPATSEPPAGGSEEQCQLGPCHGLDVSCSAGPPMMCTQMYALGDFCRQFASCARKGGQCELVKDPKFDECKTCVDACKGASGPDAFNCEGKCREKLE